MNFFALFFKKTLRYLLKPLSFLPAVLMMYTIYSFSAQTGEVSGTLSLGTSKLLVLAYNKLFMKGYSNELLEVLIVQIHPLVRKLAHVGVYFGLALSVSLPLYVYRIRGFYLFLTGGVFCIIFAFFDEYHQSFVAGRGPSLRDVGIDGIGILLGLICAEILCFIGKKTLFQSLSLEDYYRKKKAYEEQKREEEYFDRK